MPPKPPMFDVRTPEYTVFDDVQPTPWECVRGIDRSFGHNEASSEELFLGRAELIWSLADIVAKGGNLLLNVGPRGIDATIAEAQTRRLDWLAEFTTASGGALFATRPWVHASGEARLGGSAAPAAGRAEVRYTAQDRSVFAIVRLEAGSGSDPGTGSDRVGSDEGVEVLLAEVDPTPTTAVTDLAGQTLRSRATDGGLTVWITEPLSEEQPVVVVLHDVRARPTA